MDPCNSSRVTNVSGSSPVPSPCSFAPSGLVLVCSDYPRLAPRAAFLRSFGASVSALVEAFFTLAGSPTAAKRVSFDLSSRAKHAGEQSDPACEVEGPAFSRNRHRSPRRCLFSPVILSEDCSLRAQRKEQPQRRTCFWFCHPQAGIGLAQPGKFIKRRARNAAPSLCGTAHARRLNGPLSSQLREY